MKTASDRKAHATHGLARRGHVVSEFWAWSAMRQRCYNANNPEYKHYGARGIRVCREWRRNFQSFYAHVGNRPSPKHSLDRIDNTKGYYPGNVRWATRVEQMRNTRRSRMITALGRTAPLVQWAEWMKIPAYRIRNRLRRGKCAEEALGFA